MKEQLKTSVLAKCVESGNYKKLGDWEITNAWGGKWTLEHYTGDIAYSLDVNSPASHPVWPLAADILGIAQPADPLKDDRELVASAFETEDWEKELIDQACTREFINALKRLAGMEAPNE